MGDQTELIFNSENGSEIDSYVIGRIKSMIFWVLMIIVSGMISRDIRVSIVIAFSIMPIRKTGGGLHFSNELLCFCLSTFILTVASKIVASLSQVSVVLIILSGLSALSMWIIGCVDNENRKLSNCEKKFFRSVTSLLVFTEEIVALMLLINNCLKYSNSIFAGITISSLLQAVGLFVSVKRKWR